ncbi:MAG: hypothetical protein HY905_12465 [Deltaproteobacteria bacterium]|nr:hypothetical protein [Deltaproteobacteria bacterium]
MEAKLNEEGPQEDGGSQAAAASPASRPAMQRLSPYLAVAVAAIVAAGVLAALHVTREYSTPKATVTALMEALKGADLARLSTDKPLHFAERLDAEVVARGEAEYQRILEIYLEQKRLGAEEHARRVARYQEIEAAAAQGGAAQFAALPSDQRWQVWVGATSREWLYGKGRGDLAERWRPYLPASPADLDDPARRDNWVVDVGCRGLTDAAAVVAQVRAGNVPATDPLAQQAVGRCRAAGDYSVREAEGRLARAMATYDTYDSRPGESNAPGAAAREQTKAAELGRASLSAADTTFLDENRELVSTSDPEPYYWTLGWNLLSESQRRELGAKTYDQFLAEREKFVPREGRRLYTAFLTETFSNCDFTIEKTTFHGQFARGLLRTWWAEVKLAWAQSSEGDIVRFHGEELKVKPTEKVPVRFLRPSWADVPLTWGEAGSRLGLAPGVHFGTAACADYLGRELTLRYERGQWHMVWAGGLPAFDPDPDADTDEGDGAGVVAAAAATSRALPLAAAAEPNACRLMAAKACEIVGTNSGSCHDAMAAADRAGPEDLTECAEMLENHDELVGAGGGT